MRDLCFPPPQDGLPVRVQGGDASLTALSSRWAALSSILAEGDAHPSLKALVSPERPGIRPATDISTHADVLYV